MYKENIWVLPGGGSWGQKVYPTSAGFFKHDHKQDALDFEITPLSISAFLANIWEKSDPNAVVGSRQK